MVTAIRREKKIVNLRNVRNIPKKIQKSFRSCSNSSMSVMPT